GIQRIHRVHSCDYFSKWSKAFGIQGRRVVTQVDEYLRGSAIRRLKSEGHHAFRVRLPPRVVAKGAHFPRIRNPGIAIDSKLRPAILYHPEKLRLIVVTAPYQVVKAICAFWRPLPTHFDDDVALAGFEPYLKGVRRPGRHVWTLDNCPKHCQNEVCTPQHC